MSKRIAWRGFEVAPGRRTSMAGLAVLAALALSVPPAAADSHAEIARMVVVEAVRAGVPPSLALAVAEVESKFDDRAESQAGARGVMQIMPELARREYGVAGDDLWDPRRNVRLGVDHLGRLIERYGGRWDLALSHYNAGGVQGRMPGATVLPAARDYVDRVLEAQSRHAEQAALWRRVEAAEPRPSVRWWGPNRRYAGRFVPEREVVVIDRGFGGIERRRHRTRRGLDDFSPAPMVHWYPPERRHRHRRPIDWDTDWDRPFEWCADGRRHRSPCPDQYDFPGNHRNSE